MSRRKGTVVRIRGVWATISWEQDGHVWASSVPAIRLVGDDLGVHDSFWEDNDGLYWSTETVREEWLA